MPGEFVAVPIPIQNTNLGSIGAAGNASTAAIPIAANQEIWIHQVAVYHFGVGVVPAYTIEFRLGAVTVLTYQIAATQVASNPQFFKPPNDTVWRDITGALGDFTVRLTNNAAAAAIYHLDVWNEVRLRNPNA